MARPKGVIQKLDPKKYWLPKGVIVSPNAPIRYTKEQKIEFICEDFGPFITTLRAVQEANSSTHPKFTQRKREQTNLSLYNGPNPHCSPEVRQKFNSTMLERHGVEHALQNKDILTKALDTLETNYGVRNMMHSEEIRETLKNTCLDEWGVTNPLLSEVIQNQIKATNLKEYGSENYFGSKEFKDTISLVPKGVRSKGELEVEDFIRQYYPSVKQLTINKNGLTRRIDVFIPELNLGIEYNGMYWHSEAEKPVNYHKEKYDLCELSGIKLIQIWDREWINKNKQVKSFLISKIGKNIIKYGARNCFVKQIDKYEAKEFLNDYHIQGSSRFNFSYGLFHTDSKELLSVITMSKHHRKNNNEIVLSRYAGKENITVAGGLDKLCKYANKIHGTFITWVDCRFSDGSGWNQGWIKEKKLKVDYCYYNPKTQEVCSKQSRSKRAAKTPQGITERDHARSDGYLRVYDAGKIRMRYKG